MSTIDGIIAKFGGEEALAALIGRNVSTVRTWKKTGTVSVKWRARLLALAKDRGLELAPADFEPAERTENPQANTAAAVKENKPDAPARIPSGPAALRGHWKLAAGAGVAVVLLCAAVFALTRYLYRDASGVQPQTDLATDQQLVPVQFPEVAWSTYSKHESWVVRCPKEANAAALKTTCVGELAAFDGQHRRLFLMIIGHSRNGPLVLNLELPTGVTISPGVRLQFDKTQSRRLRFVMCGDKSCLTGVQLDPAFVAAGRAAKFAAITISPTSRRPLTFRIPISGFDATVSDLQ